MSFDFDKASTQARSGLVLDHPFFGQLVLRVNMIQDDSLERPVINGRTIAFPAGRMEELTLGERKATLAAAVLKCGLGHHVRRGSRDKDLWNHASDIAVGKIIADDRDLRLPNDWPNDPRFTSVDSVDKIYGILRDEAQEGDDPGKEGGEGKGKGKGRGNGGVDVDQPDSPPGGDGEGEGEGEGKGKGKPGKGQGKGRGDGSGGGEDGKPSEAPAPLTASELAQEEQDWRINMIQAANTSKAMGVCPGWAASLVDEISKPKVDWREVLRRFVEIITRGDYDFQLPDRRFAGRDFVFPDLRSEELKRICVAFDTSGSVGDFELAQFFAELSAILEGFPTAEVLLIECDTRVCHVEELTHQDLPIERVAKGRGGTMFSPVFNYIRENNEDVACVIYCTDLGSSDYGDEPPYPVLWCSSVEPDWEGTKDNWSRPPLPPWGETVWIDVDRERGM